MSNSNSMKKSNTSGIVGAFRKAYKEYIREVGEDISFCGFLKLLQYSDSEIAFIISSSTRKREHNDRKLKRQQWESRIRNIIPKQSDRKYLIDHKFGKEVNGSWKWLKNKETKAFITRDFVTLKKIYDVLISDQSLSK